MEKEPLYICDKCKFERHQDFIYFFGLRFLGLAGRGGNLNPAYRSLPDKLKRMHICNQCIDELIDVMNNFIERAS